jgi:membrane fusion protein (multidrug efflux system)
LAEAQTGPQQIAAKQAATAQAKAAVDTAQAAVDSAALQLSYTKITAPRDGSITQRSFNVGDQVQRGETIANLVFTNPWVTANFKETQVSHMRAGQPVTIAIDSLGGQTFKGHVDSVMRGTGARFALLPTENATGNYVKLVQRVPVKIVFDDLPPETAATLGLGFSVVPRVNVESP